MTKKIAVYIAILIGVYLYISLGLSKIFHICLFEELIQMHCPFCGLTTSLEELMMGKIKIAIQINPLSVIMPIYFTTDLLLHHFKLFHMRLKIEKIVLYLTVANFFYLN